MARPNQGLGALGLRGPEPKCKSINQLIMLHYHVLLIISRVLNLCFILTWILFPANSYVI